MYDHGNFVIILYKNVGILKVDVIVANIIQNPWVQLQSGISKKVLKVTVNSYVSCINQVIFDEEKSNKIIHHVIVTS